MISSGLALMSTTTTNKGVDVVMRSSLAHPESLLREARSGHYCFEHSDLGVRVSCAILHRAITAVEMIWPHPPTHPAKRDVYPVEWEEEVCIAPHTAAGIVNAESMTFLCCT